VSRRPTLVAVAHKRSRHDDTVTIEAVVHGTVRHRLTQARAGVDLVCRVVASDNSNTHTHPFNGPFSGTTRVGRYQKGKINLDFTEARDSEWQWHQLGHMQVCTSLQTDNHASIPPLSFLQAGCPSCCPTNSVNALKASTVMRGKIETQNGTRQRGTAGSTPGTPCTTD